MTKGTSEARVLANRLIAMEPGEIEQAPDCATKLLATTDYEQEEMPRIIGDLRARKDALRKIRTLPASELADVLWRTIVAMEDRQQTSAKAEAGATPPRSHHNPWDDVDGPYK